MTQICGIIAEFNPFHNGHAALVRAAREMGADYVVAVMSGNFVQRGTPAVTEKRVRTKAALLCGVDLVLELPLARATATAARFAQGAVYLLQKTGCVDRLIFGSECGDIHTLESLAKAVDHPDTLREMRRRLEGGMTFAKAREEAVAELLGRDTALHLSRPNNLLGVEYLRQAGHLGWKARPMTIPRMGVEHDAAEASGGFASASYLRGMAHRLEDTVPFVPEEAAAVYAEALTKGLYPADPAKLETAILAHLRRMGQEEFAALPDLSEGLENRLYSTVREAASMAELELALKTKRYTMARIRRLIAAAFLGLRREDSEALPPYIRILGIGPGGGEILRRMKGSCGLPVSASLARLRGRGGLCERFAALEELSTDLYGLCLPHPTHCGYEYTAGSVFLK